MPERFKVLLVTLQLNDARCRVLALRKSGPATRFHAVKGPISAAT